MNEQSKLGQLNKKELREGYVKPFEEATELGKKSEKAIKDLAGKTTNEGKAFNTLDTAVKTLEKEVANPKIKPEDLAKAQEKLAEAQKQRHAFLSGDAVEVSIKKGNAAKATKAEVTVAKSVSDAYKEAETAAAKVTRPAGGHFGMGMTQKGGWAAALKKNGDKMNVFKEGLSAGERGKAFGRASVVGVGAAAMIDAVFRSKDSNGEDRSGAFRIMEAVAGGAIGTAALLHGSALAR